MSFGKFAMLVGALSLAARLGGAPQAAQDQPSVQFGDVHISLGMTVDQVNQRLWKASIMVAPLQEDPLNLLVCQKDCKDAANVEGQIAFKNGHVVYAAYSMPSAESAADLAQEIAGAIENMDNKTCTVSNNTSHGTGGTFTQSIFYCGAKRFNVMTTSAFGSSAGSTNVNIEIGQLSK